MTRLPDGRWYTVVGVTGHIDHGKTSLVRALTGVDTDQHPEEKRRGITIDLGFAAWEDDQHVFAMVDAPGHQRYIGNLLAGVSAVDVGLLVVAADQGIQAQTLEHTSVLKTLGVPQLIVVISRIDLVSPERVAELREELEVFLVDCGFTEFPTIPVSSITGEGLDALKSALRQAASAAVPDEARRSDGASEPLRMPIDRVLHIPGRGLVVAGSIWSGAIAVGDQVQLVGRDDVLRVREIEVHGREVEVSHTGLRTALNLVGLSGRDPRRGDELVRPGEFTPVRRLLVRLSAFSDAPQLKNALQMQMHTATTAIEVHVRAAEPIEPGGQYDVIVETASPIVATWMQPCLFRLPHPVGCCAGGHVLGWVPSHVRARRKDLLNAARALAAAAPAERLMGWIQLTGTLDPRESWFAQWARDAIPSWSATVDEVLQTDQVIGIGPLLVSRDALHRTEAHVLRILEEHARQSADTWLLVDTLRRRLETWAPAELVDRAVERLLQEQKIVRLNRMVALASEKTLLSKKQRARMEQLLQQYESARMPPTAKELAAGLGISLDAVQTLVRHAVEQGLLIDLQGGFFIGRSVLQQLCTELHGRYQQQPELTVADIRDLWGVTRKHAIPLLEYCDRAGITRRQGDVRVAGVNLPQWVQAQTATSNKADPD
ncbi:MAG: selenocysteine-specific translation elongation factor [Planctomycetota bacterium]|nr:MAG: selenocysteine-specific translation elongation factor [Planctomycetota bacterium]